VTGIHVLGQVATEGLADHVAGTVLRSGNRLPAEDGIDVVIQVDGPPLDQPAPHTLGHGFLLVVLQAGDGLLPPVRAAHGHFFLKRLFTSCCGSAPTLAR